VVGVHESLLDVGISPADYRYRRGVERLFAHPDLTLI